MSSATNVPDLQTARLISRLAGLELPEERLQGFAFLLHRNAELMRGLCDLDYGRSEPASRFSPPPPR